MFNINNFLAITNGDKNIEGVVLEGRYANGVEFYTTQTKLVIKTKAIVLSDRLEYLIELIDSGALSIWPLDNYGGLKCIENFKNDCLRKLKVKNKTEFLYKERKKIEKNHPQVSSELARKVYGLDWYYEFSDDHEVWKRCKKAHENVLAELKAINSESFYHEYRKIIHTPLQENQRFLNG